VKRFAGKLCKRTKRKGRKQEIGVSGKLLRGCVDGTKIGENGGECCGQRVLPVKSSCVYIGHVRRRRKNKNPNTLSTGHSLILI